MVPVEIRTIREFLIYRKNFVDASKYTLLKIKKIIMSRTSGHGSDTVLL